MPPSKASLARLGEIPNEPVAASFSKFNSALAPGSP